MFGGFGELRERWDGFEVDKSGLRSLPIPMFAFAFDDEDESGRELGDVGWRQIRALDHVSYNRLEGKQVAVFEGKAHWGNVAGEAIGFKYHVRDRCKGSAIPLALTRKAVQ